MDDIRTRVEFLDGVQLEVLSSEPFTPEELSIFKMLTAAEFKLILLVEYGSELVTAN